MVKFFFFVIFNIFISPSQFSGTEIPDTVPEFVSIVLKEMEKGLKEPWDFSMRVQVSLAFSFFFLFF